jgi:hypothetical protein
MKKKTTKITELVIDEENEALAIDAISLVTSPAIEVDFVFFGKEKNNLTFAKVDEEKRELIAPALIPNKQIYRYDANTDSDYYVYFSKDTVKKAAYSYLKHNNHHKATYQHEQRVAGVLTVESWIKEGDQDKSKLYGFDLSNGTWFVKMKIENDDLWQKIKEGELKGLSIEGYFVDKLEKMGKQYTDEQIRTAYKELQAEGKIELGLIDDFNKLSSKAIKSGSNAGGDIQNWIDKLPKLITALKNSQKDQEKVIELGKKIEKGAKDLGIKIPNNIEKDLTGAKQWLAEIKSIINKAKGFKL